jgi:hypothetical protein
MQRGLEDKKEEAEAPTISQGKEGGIPSRRQSYR